MLSQGVVKSRERGAPDRWTEHGSVLLELPPNDWLFAGPVLPGQSVGELRLAAGGAGLGTLSGGSGDAGKQVRRDAIDHVDFALVLGASLGANDDDNLHVIACARVVLIDEWR